MGLVADCAAWGRWLAFVWVRLSLCHKPLVEGIR